MQSFIKKTLCIEPKRGIKKFSIVSKPVFLTKAFIFERIVDISVLESVLAVNWLGIYFVLKSAEFGVKCGV